ncbi:TATA box-binding protein-associated factor RNA polymerase I subunit B [Astatotilapia calliptera]|uniref:TATA box-binding protein-associated factor RNA polymerase I subunit B n=1 Tax=Astatotilapia calliptera TaxID=8154 RepID=A0A3P8PW85_ASTCA|nr:TATA box-binding protein-associated factor RNA polymerase I subunit B [Astatotilapia calliptera]
MDDEHTAEYTVPCAQCSAVDWGISDEGRFYCRSCHNVIERTREVVDLSFLKLSSRVSTIRGPRKKQAERGHVWMVCEGFQFILKNQADALLALGVHPQFKDDVLCPLWRCYLQKSRQAYTHDPVRSCKFRVRAVGSDLESASEGISCTDGESNPASTAGSNTENSGFWSGSSDTLTYLSARKKRSQSLLSMKKTLSLIYLALVWSREALTLSDLLRLVNEGHIPYLNAYEQLPEEMKVTGKDSLIFVVETVPSHHAVHKEAETLIQFLQLPAFPPISQQTLLHPALLSLRYLSDVNLPDELHPWVCRLLEHTGMMDQTLHTFDPHNHPTLPRYDVQAAALIIVTLKLFFCLDDMTEWHLSNDLGRQKDSGKVFNLRRWYKVMQAALIRAQERRDQNVSRKQWKSKKQIYPNKKEKCSMIKKKRIAEQVQLCFEKLASCPSGLQDVGPSSFIFCWGDEEESDGPSLHHMKLDEVVTRRYDFLTPLNDMYWHPALRRCLCYNSHYKEVEATLPRSFIWLLQLFAFMLDVKPFCLYEEVLSVERRIFDTRLYRGKSKANAGASAETAGASPEAQASLNTRTSPRRTRTSPRTAEASVGTRASHRKRQRSRKS